MVTLCLLTLSPIYHTLGTMRIFLKNPKDTFTHSLIPVIRYKIRNILWTEYRKCWLLAQKYPIYPILGTIRICLKKRATSHLIRENKPRLRKWCLRRTDGQTGLNSWGIPAEPRVQYNRNLKGSQKASTFSK